MNVPATLSAINIVVALLAALLTSRISLGPGWRELRYFAWAALAAAGFSAMQTTITLPVSDDLKAWTARLSFAFAALHGSAWILYFAAQAKRGLSSVEKVLFRVGLLSAALSVVPGFAFEDRFFDRYVPVVGETYRDLVATNVGHALMIFYNAVLARLAVGYVARWREGEVAAPGHAIGLCALLLAGINDGLAASGIGSMPYLLDTGFLGVVVAVGVTVTARFVSNARALDESNARLAETQRELVVRERLAAIGELSAVVAHEVRNPLAVIFNAVAGLKKQPLDEGSRVLIDIVEEEADRLKRLVAELLDFARPRDVNLEPVEVESLLKRAIDAALQSTRKTEVVDLHVESSLGTVRCDAELLRQAVINLVANALLAPRRRGAVRVSAETEGDRTMRLVVADDGEGIPESIAHRIFLPFFTTRPTGTGLGLPIVRRVADAHGGTVTHERTVGGGATFILRLPVRSDSGSRLAADKVSDRTLRAG